MLSGQHDSRRVVLSPRLFHQFVAWDETGRLDGMWAKSALRIKQTRHVDPDNVSNSLVERHLLIGQGWTCNVLSVQGMSICGDAYF